MFNLIDILSGLKFTLPYSS